MPLTADLPGVDRVVATLTTTPVEVRVAKQQPGTGGLPADPGFYAWWSLAGAIGGVPLVPHPLESELGLFYVGISPANSESGQTVRTRVIHNHLSGNLGSSTFRLTLAALLREDLDLHPVERSAKVVLPQAENKQLSDWQQRHLRLTWCSCAEPWMIEHQVIQRMQPPLNLAANGQHPFHRTLTDARRALRTAARVDPLLGDQPE
jgi:hypothetical protein